MTSVADGRTHIVTADDFAEGIWNGKGRYSATCGTNVLVAALVSEPGPHCRTCLRIAAEEVAQAAPQPGPITRWLRRLGQGAERRA